MKCPICGKELPTKQGMHLHMMKVHGASPRSKHKAIHYDKATVEWCNQRSDENLLLRIHNHIDNLTFSEARQARKRRLTKLVGRKEHGTKVILTPKGHEILDKITSSE